MNNTTWIISPNGLVWTLLGVVTASLVAIAVCLIVIAKRIRHNNEEKTENKESESDSYSSLVKLWTAKYGFATIIIAIASFAMSIVALCGKGNNANNAADTTAIAVMGALLTFSVAWSIWQVIDTKNTVKKAEEASKKIHEFEKEIERYKNLHRPYLAYTEGMRDFDTQNYLSAVCNFLDMADLYVDYEIELNTYMSKAITTTISCIKKEPWNYKSKMFIDRVDKIVGRLRKLNNAVSPLDAQLSRIRKELEKICEDKIPNPYPLPGEQNANDPNSN